MSYKIIPTIVFEKELKFLQRKYPSVRKDIEELIDLLQENPQLGTPLGYDCFKISVAIK